MLHLGLLFFFPSLPPKRSKSFASVSKFPVLTTSRLCIRCVKKHRGLEQHWLLKDLLGGQNPRAKRPGKARPHPPVHPSSNGTAQAHYRPTPPTLPAPFQKGDTKGRLKQGEGREGAEVGGGEGTAGRRVATDVSPVLLKCNRQWDLNSGFEARGRPDLDPVSPLRGQASIKFTGGRLLDWIRLD